jgi:hypothetical protein
MNNVNTLDSNDDAVLSGTVLSSTAVEAKGNINTYPLIGLLLAIFSGAISVGAGYLLYMLVFSN